MKEVNYTVLTNEQIAPDTWKMTLSGDTSAITRPGQFVNFHIQGLYLAPPHLRVPPGRKYPDHRL